MPTAGLLKLSDDECRGLALRAIVRIFGGRSTPQGLRRGRMIASIMVAYYQEGVLIEDLAARHGMAKGTISRILRRGQSELTTLQAWPRTWPRRAA